MRLGIYCRISRAKEEGKDRSIDNQKLLGIEKAKELGMEYKIYCDEGKSAASDNIDDRTEFQNLLGDISIGFITAVFAFDQSRFERNPQVRFVTNNIFKKYDIKYYTHVDGVVDLHDPQAEFFGDIVSVINRYQVTMTKIKVKSVLKQRALEGKNHGIDPFGYHKDKNGYIAVNPDEEHVVKKIFELSLQGIGTKSIAEILNAENEPTRYNKIKTGGFLKVKNKYTNETTTINKKDIKWSGNTVRNIITNTIYKGKRVYNNLVCDVPKIIEPDYFDSVNANLHNNRNNSGKKVVHQYLLKGLLRCGVCGRNYYGRARVSKRDYYYMCSSKRLHDSTCGNRSIHIDKLEDLVWYNLFHKEGFTDKLQQEFSGKHVKIEVINEEISLLKKTIESKSNEKQRAINLTLKGIVDEQDLISSIKKIDSQIKEIQILLDEKIKVYNNIKEGDALIEKYKNNFVDFTKISSFTQKQKVINDFIKNIIITCVNETYYSIRIQYKIDVEDEIWNSLNLKDVVFTRLIKDSNGEHKAFLSVPPPIKNPESEKRYNNFVDKIEKAQEDREKYFEEMEEDYQEFLKKHNNKT